MVAVCSTQKPTHLSLVSSVLRCRQCIKALLKLVSGPVTPVRTQDTQYAWDGFYLQLCVFFSFLIPTAFQLSRPVPLSSRSQCHGKRKSIIVELLSAPLPASLTLPLKPTAPRLLCSRAADHASATGPLLLLLLLVHEPAVEESEVIVYKELKRNQDLKAMKVRTAIPVCAFHALIYDMWIFFHSSPNPCELHYHSKNVSIHVHYRKCTWMDTFAEPQVCRTCAQGPGPCKSTGIPQRIPEVAGPPLEFHSLHRGELVHIIKSEDNHQLPVQSVFLPFIIFSRVYLEESSVRLNTENYPKENN